MIKIALFVCVFTLQAACAAPAQPELAQKLPIETASSLTAQPVIDPALGSSVLLALLDQSQLDYEVRPVDPATGQELPGYSPITLEQSLQHTLSGDGQKLALVTGTGDHCKPYMGGTSCWGILNMLHIVDLPSWQEVTAELPGKGVVSQLAFSPDGAHLALSYQEGDTNTLLLIDAMTGKLLKQQMLGFQPSLLAYTQDGAHLVLYGQPTGPDQWMSQPDPPRALLLDAKTLESLWDQRLEEILSGSWCLENCEASHEQISFAEWWPAVVLSPDGEKLYILHADEEKLTTVDFQAQRVRSVEVQVARSWLERLLVLTAGVARAKGAANGVSKDAVLSADGERLYQVGWRMSSKHRENGDWQVEQESLNLKVVDVNSGREFASRESQANQIRISPDGSHLILNGWGKQEPWAEVLGVQNLELVTRLEGWEILAARRLDGQPVYLGSQPGKNQTKLALFDSDTFQIIHEWRVRGYATWVVAR